MPRKKKEPQPIQPPPLPPVMKPGALYPISSYSVSDWEQSSEWSTTTRAGVRPYTACALASDFDLARKSLGKFGALKVKGIQYPGMTYARAYEYDATIVALALEYRVLRLRPHGWSWEPCYQLGEGELITVAQLVNTPALKF